MNYEMSQRRWFLKQLLSGNPIITSGKSDYVRQYDFLSRFDEAAVGKAGHFVTIQASAASPIDFEMGSPEGQLGHSSSERLHKVRITKSYEIQSTDVTQLQWYMVMKGTGIATPSYFKSQSSCDPGNYQTVNLSGADVGTTSPGICKNHPVEQVSWNDAQAFIKKLNQMQSEYVYSLPTEAQWEYVAKSGLPSEYAYGWGGDFDGAYAWYSGNSKNQTHEVGTRNGIPSPQDPNEFVYDTAGNVWQWINDWYDSYPSTDSVAIDPSGPASGSFRVVRGGSWSSVAQYLRSGSRGFGGPGVRNGSIGFRLVRTKK